MRNFEREGQIEHSVSWAEGFLMGSLPLFAVFAISWHDNFGSLSPRPQREWMRKGAALAEMPEIDHRISQAFQSIMQLTDALETD